ncbi:eukaryotic translation initiation factor 4E transporter isoform X2 [Denticeps clupeoides]|uniref:Eukaryotic translation initiation factor 4E transporter n=1 Tax=Denticeps clupeoides TaxID=299321 RepID=A0AAY4A844_9TELE|nr:eukaryotic translation initiation factor 4E transporter isoform X2 [Denticeps clupeoides]
MEKDACMEEQESCGSPPEVLKEPVTGPSPYRYTKEELLQIKELPCSNERPECLLEKYDSDGVWDPEKWHASLYPSERDSPVESYRKDYSEDRVPLKRRIADPRERLKEDDIEVVLSPQRRSFGGGCQGSAAPAVNRRPISPLENKENESLRLVGTRRIGSGRIIAARGFERDIRVEKDRERDRDFKDKRFRRDFGDKRVFSERRRNDSYAEEEPEWFSGGPTSQSETIELIGFDDKILEEDRRKTKRLRKRTESVKEVECNGGLLEEAEGMPESGADQEVPHTEVLPDQNAGDFDFNEFFNLEKTMPGLASMIEDVLGEGPGSTSRFSRWFSTNHSPSGSRSSSLRSTPHEELEKLAGLDLHCSSPGQGPVSYFTPITAVEQKEKVDILELLHKAKIDLKPLLSSLSVNKARLKESSSSGVVLSLEEVEVGLKELKVESVQQLPPTRGGCGTPFMAEQLEQALTGTSGSSSCPRDGDMSAFNKFVNSMKASGTLPTQPNGDPAVISVPEAPLPAVPQSNIFRELIQGAPHVGSQNLLASLLGSTESHSAQAPRLLHHRGQSPPLFSQRPPMQDFYMQSNAGYPVGSQSLLGDRMPDLHRALSPVHGPQQIRGIPMGLDAADLEALVYQQDLALHGRHPYQHGYNKGHDKTYRTRQPRMNRSPGPQPPGRTSPSTGVTSMLSPSFTPTSVIRKMYESKERSREESVSQSVNKDDTANSQADSTSPNSCLDGVEGEAPQPGAAKACSTPVSCAPSHHSRQAKDCEQTRPGVTSSGHHNPTMGSPGSSSTYSCPIYPVPLMSHVPMVRPSPPQLHPSVVQRMLAQGIRPQQLGPTLLQAGVYPPTVDLSQIQGLPPALLGQPLYPLSPSGHPLLPSRAGPHVQLAVMHQQLQQQRPTLHPAPQGHGLNRTSQSQRTGGSPPLGLAKWFGSDVLQQPLPSMPSKVISVDELECTQ